MICCADLHLRHDRPISRKDDYFLAQERKFTAILDLAENSPPLVIAGDFFHKARPPIRLIRWVMDKLGETDLIPIVVPGQHDLPFHSITHLPESGLGLLDAAGFVEVLSVNNHAYHLKPYTFVGCPFGTSPPVFEQVHAKGNSLLKYWNETIILIWHHLVIKKGEELWPGQDATIAGKILREHPQYHFIITGDNHRKFTESFRKRRLINPGSMMRMTIDQRDAEPSVFEITDKGEVVEHKLPTEKDVFDLELAVDRVEREERINSFITHLMSDYEVSASFERNLEQVLMKQKVSPEVKEIIKTCLG